MGEWSNLTQREKSNIIRFAIKNGVSDINTIRDTFNVYISGNGGENEYKEGGSIHIKPSKRGTFTAAATKHGKSVQEFARQVLANKENYSPAMVKKANFARNAAHWHKHDQATPESLADVNSGWLRTDWGGSSTPEEIRARLLQQSLPSTATAQIRATTKEDIERRKEETERLEFAQKIRPTLEQAVNTMAIGSNFNTSAMSNEALLDLGSKLSNQWNIALSTGTSGPITTLVGIGTGYLGGEVGNYINRRTGNHLSEPAARLLGSLAGSYYGGKSANTATTTYNNLSLLSKPLTVSEKIKHSAANALWDLPVLDLITSPLGKIATYKALQLNKGAATPYLSNILKSAFRSSRKSELEAELYGGIGLDEPFNLYRLSQLYRQGIFGNSKFYSKLFPSELEKVIIRPKDLPIPEIGDGVTSPFYSPESTPTFRLDVHNFGASPKTHTGKISTSTYRLRSNNYSGWRPVNNTAEELTDRFYIKPEKDQSKLFNHSSQDIGGHWERRIKGKDNYSEEIFDLQHFTPINYQYRWGKDDFARIAALYGLNRNWTPFGLYFKGTAPINYSTGGPLYLYPFSFQKNPYWKTPVVRYDSGGTLGHQYGIGDFLSKLFAPTYSGDFSTAFASARNDGNSYFKWNGNRYSTQWETEKYKEEHPEEYVPEFAYTDAMNRIAREENTKLVKNGYIPELDAWQPHKSVEGGARTIGYGLKLGPHNQAVLDELERNKSDKYPNGYISDAFALQQSANLLRDEYEPLAKKYWNSTFNDDSWDNLSPKMKSIILDYQYNVRGGIKEFPKLMRAIHDKDYDGIKANYKRYANKRELGRNKGIAQELERLFGGYYSVYND